MRFAMELALSNALAALALAAVVYLATQIITRPAVRHLLWGLVLLRLALPPIGGFEFRVFSSLDEPAAEPAFVGQPLAPSELAFDEAELAMIARYALGPQTAEPAVVPEGEPDSAAAFPVWEAAVMAVWLTGAFGIWSLAWVRSRRFGRAIRRADPADPAVQSRCDSVAREFGLRRPPLVRTTTARLPPLLWPAPVPFGRATVLIPDGLIARLDGARLDAVFAHELAHLKRGDAWWRRLELFLRGAYWWFPPVYWFGRQLRAAEEECCDVMACGGRSPVASRRTYAETLIDVAGFLSSPEPRPLPDLACGIDAAQHLKRRVVVIMKGTPARAGIWGLALILGLGVAAFASRPVLADDEERDKAPAERAEARDGDKVKPEGKDKPKEKVKEEAKDKPKEKIKEEAKDKPKEKVKEDVRDEEKEKSGDEAKPSVGEVRAELERARAELREQMARVQKLEMRLAQMTWGRGPWVEMEFRIPPPFRGEAPAPQFAEMERRFAEMERMMAEMRRQMGTMREGGPREGRGRPGAEGEERGRPEREREREDERPRPPRPERDGN